MNEISELMSQLANDEGFNDTLITSVRIFKASQYQPRQPLCYDQGIIVVGQGTKRLFLGNTKYEYDPDNYLVLSVPLPAECEILADEQIPLLALAVDFDIWTLNRIFGQMDQHIDHTHIKHNKYHKGLFVNQTTIEIKDSVTRLLRALQSPLESQVIGQGIIYELIFRIMCGENASSLYALAMQNTHLAKIDKALKLIHENYHQSMNIQKLSNAVNMSPSAFHRTFKEVTASSPIQYIKKVRLNKARNLLIEERIRVNEAAMRVGYESVTQFSREFKRYFYKSPVNFMGTSNPA